MGDPVAFMEHDDARGGAVGERTGEEIRKRDGRHDPILSSLS
jgi:hypothetical protein